jgi:hypothetical protein
MNKNLYKSLYTTPLGANIYLKFEPSFIGQSEGSVLNLIFMAQEEATFFKKLPKWNKNSAKISPVAWPDFIFGISPQVTSNPALEVNSIVQYLASCGIIVKFQPSDLIK